jgi:hypothetical protein
MEAPDTDLLHMQPGRAGQTLFSPDVWIFAKTTAPATIIIAPTLKRILFIRNGIYF